MITVTGNNIFRQRSRSRRRRPCLRSLMASTVFWPECVPIARTPTRVNKHCDFNLLIEWSVDLITIATTQPFALKRTAELLFCSLGNFSNDDGNGNVNVISKHKFQSRLI